MCSDERATGALPQSSALVIFRASKTEVRMDDERRRVTVILDQDVKAAVERVAERERGSVSGVIRRVVSEWAAGREPVGRAA
jgi:hypothetical protein